MVDGSSGDRPPRGYSWESFTIGNAAAETHGATSPRRIRARAAEIRDALFARVDFAYLRAPQFELSVVRWSEAEATIDMLLDWFEKLPEPVPGQPELAEITETEESTEEPSAGKGGRGSRSARTRRIESPLKMLAAAQRNAATLRGQLALNPAAAAMLSRDLGLTQQRQDDQISSLARQGADIRARREAAIAAGEPWPPPRALPPAG